MLLRLMLFCLLVVTLEAKEQTFYSKKYTKQTKEPSWHSQINFEFEAAYQLADFSGTISNGESSANFRDDFSYSDTAFSYFALDMKFDYAYVPNVKISYFNNEEITNSTLSKPIVIADGSFDINDTVNTAVNNQVLNLLLYTTFKNKGRFVKFLRWKFYSGDLDFDVGMNTKFIKWDFVIFHANELNPTKHWILSDEIIFMPYIGFKYYLYRMRMFANVSALSLSEAKSTYFEGGFDFRVVDTLYISAAYMYEDFKVTELRDNVDFKTNGFKFGFKYDF